MAEEKKRVVVLRKKKDVKKTFSEKDEPIRKKVASSGLKKKKIYVNSNFSSKEKSYNKYDKTKKSYVKKDFKKKPFVKKSFNKKPTQNRPENLYNLIGKDVVCALKMYKTSNIRSICFNFDIDDIERKNKIVDFYKKNLVKTIEDTKKKRKVFKKKFNIKIFVSEVKTNEEFKNERKLYLTCYDKWREGTTTLNIR